MEPTTALYRKYRPQHFDDVLGQDHIVKVLKGALELGNVAHAYLFFGSRGTGKTTMARIIAATLHTSASDVYEIDAASNRGIDDIRQLRESVRTRPFDSAYKVYIIDEVHMLSKDAFNALLKTLEEPPEYVIFILATTEIDKVPETIISRCQTFTFKRPNDVLLKEMVLDISKKEGCALSDDAAALIALLGDGSFRDAQGILQKVMSFSNDTTLSLEEVEEVTGSPKVSLVNQVLESIIERDVARGKEAIAQAVEANTDMSVFLKLLIAQAREKLLEGESVTPAILRALLRAHEEMRVAFIPQLPLEIALVDIANSK